MNERMNEWMNFIYMSWGFSIAANWRHLNNKAIYMTKTYYDKRKEKKHYYKTYYNKIQELTVQTGDNRFASFRIIVCGFSLFL